VIIDEQDPDRVTSDGVHGWADSAMVSAARARAAHFPARRVGDRSTALKRP
jgi:hypothetical protein